MIKKVAAGLLLAVSLLGAACSSGNDDNADAPQPAAAPTETGDSESLEPAPTQDAAAEQEEAEESGQVSPALTGEVAEAIINLAFLADPGQLGPITDEQMRCVGEAAPFALGEERLAELGINGSSLEAAYRDSESFLLGERFGVSQAEIDAILEEVAACADWRELILEGITGGVPSEMAECVVAEISDAAIYFVLGSLLISPERPLGAASEPVGQELNGQELNQLLQSCYDLRSIIYDGLVEGGLTSEQSAQCVVDGISDELVERYLLVFSDQDETGEAQGAALELVDIHRQCLTPEELESIGLADSSGPGFAPPDEFGSGPCPPADGSGPRVLDFDGPPPMCLDSSKEYAAVFDTTAGELRIALDTVNTPVTANNFAVLARYRYYDDTLLFRTDPSIGIIQGGSPRTNSPSDPGPGYTIVDEGSGFAYEPGQIVMARTGAPNSAGAQFFFAVNENTALLNSQGTYVVFGRMDEASLAVAEAILASHVDQPDNPLGGGPDPQVIVNSITIQESG